MKIEEICLRRVASWFISGTGCSKEENTIDAGLPLLQRNWVWSAEKVTTFWDSLARNIPVGSIILAEKKSNVRRGVMADKKKAKDTRNITHEILDGQQRTTAIATAFADAWDGEFENNNPPAMLWVSLKDEALQFHLTTKQHPWGFDEKGKRLSPNKRKEAIEKLFGNQSENYTQKNAYPYICLEKKINAFPVCKIIQEKYVVEDYIKDLHVEESKNEWKILSKRIMSIINSYKLPAILSSIKKDDIELTFTRLNTQGEVLDGEELRYSIIKAKCENAENFVNEVERNSKLFPASRIILLYQRLVESWRKIEKKSGKIIDTSFPPYRNNMDDFKKHLDIESLNDKFEKGVEVFENFNSLIRLKTENNDFGLSAPLINLLGNGTENREIIFIFLYWLSYVDIKELDDENKKTAIGALTLMSWFSEKPSKIVPKLWIKILYKIEHKENLYSFWEEELSAIAFSEEFKDSLPIYQAKSKKELSEFINDTFDSEGYYLQNNNSYLYKMIPSNITETERIYWWQTINKVIKSSVSKPYLTYYFQRHYMKDKFKNYDPTLTSKQNDIQRPWDIDHIIPQSKLTKNSKCLYKFWIHSVGNYCAMDYSLNRSKSDKNDLNYVEFYKTLQINNHGNETMKEFKNFIEPKEVNENKISNIKDYPYVYPIFKRLLLMYTHWYDTLNIEKIIKE